MAAHGRRISSLSVTYQEEVHRQETDSPGTMKSSNLSFERGFLGQDTAVNFHYPQLYMKPNLLVPPPAVRESISSGSVNTGLPSITHAAVPVPGNETLLEICDNFDASHCDVEDTIIQNYEPPLSQGSINSGIGVGSKCELNQNTHTTIDEHLPQFSSSQSRIAAKVTTEQSLPIASGIDDETLAHIHGNFTPSMELPLQTIGSTSSASMFLPNVCSHMQENTSMLGQQIVPITQGLAGSSGIFQGSHDATFSNNSCHSQLQPFYSSTEIFPCSLKLPITSASTLSSEAPPSNSSTGITQDSTLLAESSQMVHGSQTVGSGSTPHHNQTTDVQEIAGAGVSKPVALVPTTVYNTPSLPLPSPWPAGNPLYGLEDGLRHRINIQIEDFRSLVQQTLYDQFNNYRYHQYQDPSAAHSCMDQHVGDAHLNSVISSRSSITGTDCEQSIHSSPEQESSQHGSDVHNKNGYTEGTSRASVVTCSDELEHQINCQLIQLQTCTALISNTLRTRTEYSTT